MDDDDVHMCLVCQTTIAGLLNYVNHKKNECSGRKGTKLEPPINIQPSTYSNIVTDLQNHSLNSFTLGGGSSTYLTQSYTNNTNNQQSFTLGSSLQPSVSGFGDSVLNTQVSISNALDTVFDTATYQQASAEGVNHLTDINNYLKPYNATTTCTPIAVSSQNMVLFDSQNSIISSSQTHSDLSCALGLSPSIFTSAQTTLNLGKNVESSTIDEDHGILNACIGNISNQDHYNGDVGDFTQSVIVQIPDAYSMMNSDKSPNTNNSVNINDIISSNREKEEESHKTASEKVEDFFQSLELRSKTAPRIEKGASYSQPLLPISNILNNLTFSSDEDDLGFNFADNVSLDSFSENSDDEMAPPSHHTSGKWKPGENPEVLRRHRQTFRGKWPPGQAPIQMSATYHDKRSRGGKNIGAFTDHSTKKKKNKSRVKIKKGENSKTFSCTFCNVTFMCRFKYSSHCGSLQHKENVFGKRDDLQSQYKRGRGKSFKMVPDGDENQEVVEEGCDVLSDIQQIGIEDENNQNPDNATNKNENYEFEHYENAENHENYAVTGNIDSNEKSCLSVGNDDKETVKNAEIHEEEQPQMASRSETEAFTELHVCTICDKKYNNKYLVSRHLLTKYHRNRSAANPREAFDLLEKYHKYIVRLSPFQCEICRFYFNTHQEFDNHLKSIQHLKNCDDLIGEMTCTLCKFRTHCQSIMAQHFECGEHVTNVAKCDKICILKESHVKCRCKFCGLVMRSFTRLKHHVMIKHIDRRIVPGVVKKQVGKKNNPICSMCSKQFQSPSALNLHFRRKHSKIRPYNCDTCNMSFAGKYALQMHCNTSRHFQIVDGLKNMKKEKVNIDSDATIEPSVTDKVEADIRVRKLATSRADIDSDGLPDIGNAATEVKQTREYKQDGEDDTDAYYELTDNENDAQNGVTNTLFNDSGIVDNNSDLDDNIDKEWVPIKASRKRKQKLGGFVVKIKKPKIPRVQKTHIKASKDKTYKCNHCAFTVKVYNDLRPHYMKEHSGQIKLCEICDLIFLSEKALKLHILSKDHQENIDKSGETSIQYFQCHICKKRFTDEKYCKFHTAFSHFHLTSEEAVLSEYKGQDITRQRFHEVLKEIEPLDYHAKVQCPECNIFFKKNHFIEHLRMHTNDRPFKCKMCPKEFLSGVTLRRHLLGHFGCSEKTCENCGKFFKKTGSFKDHMVLCNAKKADADKDHICETCGQSFYLEHQLQTHVKRHGKREYVCTVSGCPWRFVYANELKFHMHSHTGHKPFLCDICGYAAVTKYRLRRHHRTHTGERNYHCDYCTYKAGNSTHLHRHMRIHIGSKPFKCPHCDYTCNTHENMRKHIMHTKKHDGLKIYPCKFCDYGTNNCKEFRYHLMQTHETEIGPEFRATALSMFTGLYHKELDPKRPEEGMKIIQIKERIPKSEQQKTRKRKNKSDTDRKDQKVNSDNADISVKKEVHVNSQENIKDSIEIKPLKLLPSKKQTLTDSNKASKKTKCVAIAGQYSEDKHASHDGTFHLYPALSELHTKEEYMNNSPFPAGPLSKNRNTASPYRSYTQSVPPQFKSDMSSAASSTSIHGNPNHNHGANAKNLTGGAVPDMFHKNQGQANYVSLIGQNLAKTNRESISMYRDYCTKLGVSNQKGDDPDAPGNLIIDMGYSAN